jgi:hypothetical protein
LAGDSVGLNVGGFDPNRPDLEVEVEVEVEVRAGGEEAVTAVSRRGEVHSHSGPANSPDVVVSGPADSIIGLLAGRLDKDAAVEEGVSILDTEQHTLRITYQSSHDFETTRAFLNETIEIV